MKILTTFLTKILRCRDPRCKHEYLEYLDKSENTEELTVKLALLVSLVKQFHNLDMYFLNSDHHICTHTQIELGTLSVAIIARDCSLQYLKPRELTAIIAAIFFNSDNHFWWGRVGNTNTIRFGNHTCRKTQHWNNSRKISCWVSVELW